MNAKIGYLDNYNKILYNRANKLNEENNSLKKENDDLKESLKMRDTCIDVFNDEKIINIQNNNEEKIISLKKDLAKFV